jgi:hypothetical protein
MTCICQKKVFMGHLNFPFFPKCIPRVITDPVPNLNNLARKNMLNNMSVFRMEVQLISSISVTTNSDEMLHLKICRYF